MALAGRHPLAPGIAALGFAAWSVAAARRPLLWLAVVPAALPLANLLPWTGWLAFDEFDLLLLGAFAGGHARLAFGGMPRQRAPADAVGLALIAAFAAASAVAFTRGLMDAGGLHWSPGALFQGYADPLNAWRVFKPLPYALLALPLALDALARSPAQAARRFGCGMLAGLAVASLAVLWERAAYPGLFDWSGPYRATALFWEMHVGGATIDVYLVLAAPFAAWALARARTPARWAAAALLALLAAHAALATLSRGVWGTVAFEMLLLLAAWGYRRRRARRPAPAAPRWLRRDNLLLACALALECAAVFYASTFARERLAESAFDLVDRVDHWRRGVGLPHGAGEWLLGIGAGRLPARFMGAGEGTGHERSGALHLKPRGGAGYSAWLTGPARKPSLGRRHALAQRVDPGARPVQAEITLRTLRDAELRLLVCERHLLYMRRCLGAIVEAKAAGGAWQKLSVALAPAPGPGVPASGDWYAPRLGLFTLSVLTPGASVELARVGLMSEAGGELLVNTSFADGLAHWFPAAQRYFLPWHADNLYLEVLIERGAVGLVAFMALLGWSLRKGWRVGIGAGAGLGTGAARRGSLAPCAFAALAGAALLGGVSSVLDTPRTAFLFLLLLCVAAAAPVRRRRRPGDDGAPCPPPPTPSCTAAATSAS